MNGYKVIVDKSTVPVGTAEKVREIIRRETTHPFSVVSNPEFLKQGAAVDDFLKPDRVVIGAEDEKGGEIMRQLYAPFTRTGAPIMVMDCASAELCKYAANALLATKISFMNEIANVCELFGADVDQVRRAVGSDRRIGPSFLFPGVGYGGSCFPKDVKAIVKFTGDKGYDFQILKAVERVNHRQKSVLAGRMEKHFGSLKGRTIAVWGLAFKPRTDDMREAPAIVLIERLLAAGAKVQAFDPAAMPVAQTALRHPASPTRRRSYAALAGADALAVVTEWNEFREPDFAQDAQADEEPGHLRRAQHLLPRADAGEWLHLLLHWTLTAARSSSPAAPATSAATRPRPSPRAGRRVVVYDDLSAGHRGAVRWCDLVVGDLHDDGAAAARRSARYRRGAPSCTSPRWPSVGDSVRDPSPLLPRERRGHAGPAAGDGRGGRAAARLLVDGGGVRRADRDADHRGAPTRGRSTRTARRSWPSSGRSPHFERAYGLRSVALRYFNAAGRRPGRRDSARTTAPRRT